MAQYSTWISYGGAAKIILAIVLLIAAAAVAYAGTRLPLPARAPRPGQAAANLMLAAWVAAIIAFVGCVSVLVQQARREHLHQIRPPDPITPVTLTAVAVIFVIIVITSSHGWPVRLAGAAIGALAAPLPYALNVVSKILAFVTALSLFLPQRATASAPRPAPGGSRGRQAWTHAYWSKSRTTRSAAGCDWQARA
jgi:hypothetical protein